MDKLVSVKYVNDVDQLADDDRVCLYTQNCAEWLLYMYVYKDVWEPCTKSFDAQHKGGLTTVLQSQSMVTKTPQYNCGSTTYIYFSAVTTLYENPLCQHNVL